MPFRRPASVMRRQAVPLESGAGHAAAGRVVLTLLGTPAFERADGTRCLLKPQDAALLAILALDGPTLRDRMVGLLWPDSALAAGKNTLGQRLFKLRRAGFDGVVNAELMRFETGVQHDLALVDTDGPPGELLGSFDFPSNDALHEWLVRQRGQWRASRADGLAERAELAARQGHTAEALKLAQRLALHEPLLEHAARRVMRLHHDRGDRAAAVAEFERLRHAVHRELGAQPDPETQGLFEAIRDGTRVARSHGADARREVAAPLQLAGREAEWAALDAAWARRRAIFVSGEAGMGKSHLIAAFAQARGVVHRVESLAGDVLVPYSFAGRIARSLLGTAREVADERTSAATRAKGKAASRPAWVDDALAHLLPEAGRPALAAVDPLRLARALEHLCREAGAIALDELHLADAASLDILPLLLDGPTRWLLGARRDELPPATRDWLAQMSAARLVMIELAPLDASAVGAMLAALAAAHAEPAALAQRFVAHTGGNPMFVLETARAVLGRAGHSGWPPLHDIALPTTRKITQTIQRRLEHLSPPALRLARLMAVAEQDFDAELGAHVLGQHPLHWTPDLDELRAFSVVRGQALAHGLFSETLLAHLPDLIARWLHERVAEHLSVRPVPPARLAVHWRVARRWPEAGVAFAAAASAALRASRRGDELLMLEAAVDCFERAGDATAFVDALDRAAHAAFHVADLNRVRVLAARLDAAAPDDTVRARAAAHLAHLHATLTEWPASLAMARRAAALAGDADPALRSRIERTLAAALANLGEPAQALALIAGVAERLRAEVPTDEQGTALSDCAFVLQACDKRELALAQGQAAYEFAVRTENWSAAHAMLGDQSIRLLYLDRLAESVAALEQASALRHRLVDPGTGKGWSLMDDMALAGGYADLGRFAEALALARPTLAGLRAGGFVTWAINAEHDLSSLYLRLGQVEEAFDVLTPLPVDAPAWLHGARHLMHARLARARGEPSLPALEAAWASLGPTGGPSYVRLKLAVELARARGGPGAAAELDALADAAAAREHVAVAWLARSYRVEALLGAGGVDAAVALARAVTDHLDGRDPWILYAPEARWLCHAAFRRAGDTARAAESLAKARNWIARADVPAEFSVDFSEANLINRAIVRAVRQGASPGP